jgi:homoserine kinase
MDLITTPVTVRVPATSANLGPGFDALGLALTHHDVVRARVTSGGVQVEVVGEGAGMLPSDERHLVVRAMFEAFDALGTRPPGLALRCHNRIPQARGLGSSSAAIVAGIQLARGLVRDGAAAMDDAAALRLAARIEGHPDNVAACLLGGLTIAWSTPASGIGAARAVHLEPAPTVRPTVLVPTQTALTETARAALPATVPHADAASNAGRAALLVHALTRDVSLLFDATEDRLHQDYRAPGMPETGALVRRLRADGLAAVVSGAGPSVLVLATRHWAAPDLPGWQALRLAVDPHGASYVGNETERG